ncbi:MAG TPA: OmpA family protein [Polyangia bacterium]|nr:OmpA family protein [Polyangia bacterium]
MPVSAGKAVLPLVWLLAACATRAPAPAASPPPVAAKAPPPVTHFETAATPPGPPDRDGDHVPDSRDRCPDEPETYNGYQDADGCPDHGISGHTGSRQILDKFYFPPTSHALGADMKPLLDAIGAAIVGNPEIVLIEVRGYATGDERAPMRLATARAQTIRTALIHRGVAPGRLRARGYGATNPICTTDDEDCRRANRRVEFLIPQFLQPAPPAPPPGQAPPDDRTLAKPASDPS